MDHFLASPSSKRYLTKTEGEILCYSVPVNSASNHSKNEPSSPSPHKTSFKTLSPPIQIKPPGWSIRPTTQQTGTRPMTFSHSAKPFPALQQATPSLLTPALQTKRSPLTVANSKSPKGSPLMPRVSAVLPSTLTRKAAFFIPPAVQEKIPLKLNYSISQ